MVACRVSSHGPGVHVAMMERAVGVAGTVGVQVGVSGMGMETSGTGVLVGIVGMKMRVTSTDCDIGVLMGKMSAATVSVGVAVGSSCASALLASDSSP